MFRILSLDGGGAKGMYTLGALSIIEEFENKRLSDVFDLFYGASTGSIIASMLSSGALVEDIRSEYQNVIPRAFRTSGSKNRSAALNAEAARIFSFGFDSLLKPTGIVCTNYSDKSTTVFKSHPSQIHTGRVGFKSGMGASLSQVVMASCAAFPFFEPVEVETSLFGKLQLVDGGFVANNPSVYALGDALGAMNKKASEVFLCSLGTGIFHEAAPPLRGKEWLVTKLAAMTDFGKVMSSVLSANANSISNTVKFAFPEVATVRMNGGSAAISTSLLESNVGTLQKLYEIGRRDLNACLDEYQSLSNQ